MGLDRLNASSDNDARGACAEAKAERLLQIALRNAEREREHPGADLPARLRQPIAALRRVARECPAFSKMRYVYFELGHDLREAGRLEEAVNVWRSLVCHSLYPYPVEPDPIDPDRDRVTPLVQDHPSQFWEQWSARHPDPASVAKPSANPEAEERFRNPYPDSCVPLAGKEASDRLLDEVWFRIGEYHFEGLDHTASIYSLNRAAVSYRKALSISRNNDKLTALASYKLAWTYYKQQRYQAAIKQFVDVLRLNAGEDFQSEAVAYIAGAMVNTDLVGPAEDEPFIARKDVLDQETVPQIAEQKMSVGKTRVQSALLLPQDQPWTPLVYLALAREYRELMQYRNAIDVYERLLKQWPVHRQSLIAALEKAMCWETLARASRRNLAYRNRAAAAFKEVMRQARAGGTWFDAHASDASCLDEANRMVPAAEQHLRALP